ncbi:hypothetical protein J7E78_12070 [Paenibacillus polymyxa]|uniref:hypothetical protein n=1 Tax=Paenibacillus polymyxa TaxID=1406 RepID=UPI001BED35BF|nr:hypothetical protein [Paenibacillus polymyxa]MBT2284274.1 hypothetical protein [Paenibacillus polymyxa]
MQLNEVLKEEYYYDSSGKPNEIVQSLGNCLTRNIYFMLRKRFENPTLLMSAYIDDFSMILMTDVQDRIIDIQINDIKSPDCYVYEKNKIEIENNGQQAIQHIESLLLQEEIVYVNTMMKLVPYYRTFKENPSEEELSVVDSHIFLILGQTNDDFYYMDNPVNYSGRFRAYSENKSIGIDTKSNFYNAFNRQFNCFTLEPNDAELRNLNTRIPYIMNQSVVNYKTKVIDNNDGQIVYPGRIMLRKFIDLYTKGKISLNDYVQNKDRDVFTLSRTVFNRNLDRKKVLLLFLEDLPCCPSKQKLVHTMEENIEKWELAKNNLTKKFMKEDFACDEKMGVLLEHALESEDVMFQTLEDHLDFINTTLIFK